MLPGVEVARIRRLHHHPHRHDAPPRGHRDPWGARSPEPAVAMDAVALAARRRLELKLRRFDLGLIPDPVPSSSRNRNNVGTARETAAPARVMVRMESREVCAVCLEEMTTTETSMTSSGEGEMAVERLPCTHKYHSDCLRTWLAAQPVCPCCRTPVPSLPHL